MTALGGGRLILRIARWTGVVASVLTMIVFTQAWAQKADRGVPNAMQGFAQNRDQPIQIEAASLEMRDKKKEATFAGNVKVVQGDTTMTSKTLVVFYDFGLVGHAVSQFGGDKVGSDAVGDAGSRRQFVDPPP